MKILIAYAAKYGMTETIAEMLAERLGNAFLYDVGSEMSISLLDYDGIILGSPVMAGVISRDMKAFIETNREECMKKPLGIFLSGLQESGETEYLTKNFSKELLDKAKVKAFLGGIYSSEKLNRFSRVILRFLAKLDGSTPFIDEEKIAAFVQQFMA